MELEGNAIAAVSAWYEAHGETIFVYVARRLGQENARDVTADVFRSAIEGHHRFDRDAGTPLSWLYGIATNLIRRHWRTEQRRLRALNRLTGSVNTEAAVAARQPELSERPIERLDAHHRVEKLLAAVELLDPEDRDLLVLIAWEAKNHTEVGAILGIPPGTVASRLHRIRTQLRRQVTDHG